MQKLHLGMLVAAIFLAGCSSTVAGGKSATSAQVSVAKADIVQFDKLAGYNSAQTRIANKITARFAAAGYGPAQQIAAVSVAIRESTLNPNARNRGCNCYGLFQMNRSGGLGKGHTVANLTNADYNISLIIKEANRFSSFASAKTVDQAVSAFVRNVTRPADKPGVVRATQRTARKVEQSANSRSLALLGD
ncbi:phage tail tip lysozyme [Hoeflea sp. TYP-13]|uniref:phage tail tip lysozyme n=1 Tax=Hoeflea sp. TYP-13 TaxID=3230023 RepID=UPI0034C6A25D